MQVNIQEMLEECGLDENIYPGKKLVKKLQQPGEYKSHCIVYDWHDPETIRVEIKAGLSGRDMVAKDLSKYPVCFQAPTYIDIDVENEKANDDDEDSEGSKGKGGGGGKKPKQTKLEDAGSSMKNFLSAAEGKVPDAGEIKKLVLMGKDIAKEAFGAVLESLKAQIAHAKVTPTELLAKAGDFITKYTPPAYMEPKGDETVKYNYDREKNADIGMSRTM